MYKRQHLRTLFEQAKPDDTVSDIKARVSRWTERVISNILIASPQKEGSPFVFFAVPEDSCWLCYGEIKAAMCKQSEILQHYDIYKKLGAHLSVEDGVPAGCNLTSLSARVQI